MSVIESSIAEPIINEPDSETISQVEVHVHVCYTYLHKYTCIQFRLFFKSLDIFCINYFLMNLTHRVLQVFLIKFSLNSIDASERIILFKYRLFRILLKRL